MRKIKHLNYDWKYIDNYKDEYLAPEYEGTEFNDVVLPHTNIELPYNNFNQEEYQFVSTYRRNIFMDLEDQGKRAILHFEGVMTYAKVYINGFFIYEHKGGYTPFKCDITDFAICGKDNTLAVIVDSTEREDIPPFGYAIDFLTYGGIYREVWLEFTNEISIENMLIKTKNILLENKLMDIDIYIENKTSKNEKLTLGFTLIKEKDTILSFQEDVNISPNVISKFNILQEVQDIMLWDDANPNRYTLKVKVEQHGEVIDEYSEMFGFREAIFKNDGFYLNGKKIKLRGLNRHQSFPLVGYAMPKSAQYKDAEILKYELGINIVRLSHYPQSKHFLDRCDELGLFVFDEIPGWQHIGDRKWQKVAIKNVEEMIKTNWNRPSIIIWGVRINESQDNDEFYIETNRVARALDDSRQTGGVRNFENGNMFEDVYTFNDFIHRGDNTALKEPRDVIKKAVPYLVTEHNGHMFPTKKFDNEAKRVEHALRHLRVIDNMYGNPSISGSIGWCMFDYNTHKDFGSGDLICYHGVMDMYRIPKEAASVYASQHSANPVLDVASSMIIGERDAAELTEVYVFTNCDYIKLYKNKEYIGTYFPARDKYPHLPHPPIIVNDFIGNLIEKNESFSIKDATIVKEILHGIIKYGDKSLPLKYKAKLGWMMFKYKLSYEDAVTLYTTYVANWGCKSLMYEFEGYIEDKLVAKVTRGSTSTSELVIIPDKTSLTEAETYDVCRVVVQHVDEFGNNLTFSNEVITLELEGVGEIIGPKKLALIGGSIAFWVKTNGISGTMKVNIQNDRFGIQTVDFKVVKE